MDPNKRFRFAKKTFGQLTDALVGNSCCRPGLVILADDGEMIVKRSIVVLKLLTKGCTLIPANFALEGLNTFYYASASKNKACGFHVKVLLVLDIRGFSNMRNFSDIQGLHDQGPFLDVWSFHI